MKSQKDDLKTQVIICALLSRQEAADLLGVKPNTLAVWAMKGVGPAPTKIGRCVRYQRSVLEAFISQNTFPR